MNHSSKKQNLAVTVGFFLILIVAGFTIGKKLWNKNEETFTPPPSSTSNLNKKKEITAAELMSEINSNQNITIIDLRSPEEFKTEHIIDSKNVPFLEIENYLADFQKDTDYILVDSNQNEAIITANQILPSRNINRVKYLTGGFISWKNQFYPVVSDGDPYSITDQAKLKYLKTDELKEIMKKESNLYIIDVRKEGAYNEGRLKDAVNIYLEDLERRRHEIPKNKKIILYDNDGLWAFKGAVRLFDMGTFNVYALSEGLDVWKSNGYEIVK